MKSDNVKLKNLNPSRPLRRGKDEASEARYQNFTRLPKPIMIGWDIFNANLKHNLRVSPIISFGYRRARHFDFSIFNCIEYLLLNSFRVKFSHLINFFGRAGFQKFINFQRPLLVVARQ